MKFWRRNKGAKKPRSSAVLTLVAPEGVRLDLPLASLSQRLTAQIFDLGITLAAFLTIVLVVFLLDNNSTTMRAASTIFITLMLFFIRLPYYMVTELVWNGRTLAKRWLGLRVVSLDGRGLQTHQVVVRNLVREVEFFAPLIYLFASQYVHWTMSTMAGVTVLAVVITMKRSRFNQRLGDYLANTAVIIDPKPVMLRDMATPLNGADRVEFLFQRSQLDHYGRKELQVLEQVLRAMPAPRKADQKRQLAARASVSAQIAAKIGYEAPPTEAEAQLRFLKAFYSAQRDHLENRQIMGDARDDKNFHMQRRDGSD